MSWLLILFIIAVVISPLMWLKQSPHSKRMTELRGLANTLSIQVSLHRRPDAREDEKALEAVCYRMPWLQRDCDQSWVLQRFSQRGWDSHCEGWRWTHHQADPVWDSLLGEIIPQMPSGVTGVIANRVGIGLIWDERGNAQDLKKMSENLQALRKKAEEICH